MRCKIPSKTLSWPLLHCRRRRCFAGESRGSRGWAPVGGCFPLHLVQLLCSQDGGAHRPRAWPDVLRGSSARLSPWLAPTDSSRCRLPPLDSPLLVHLCLVVDPRAGLGCSAQPICRPRGPTALLVLEQFCGAEDSRHAGNLATRHRRASRGGAGGVGTSRESCPGSLLPTRQLALVKPSLGS